MIDLEIHNQVVIDNPNNSTCADLLSRQSFVNRMIHISHTLSENKQGKCYSINGIWGSGKSYVLDMFETQAESIGQEGSTLPQYVVFRYNCWEYDYYEEPLIAIVASILEQYKTKIEFLSSDSKKAIKIGLQIAGRKLLSILRGGIKGATGFDIQPIVDVGREILDDVNNQHETSNAYDSLFAFKSVLSELQEKLATLAEHQTIILIVDELDRCLPKYTIKVLERLHHLFNGIANIQIIISIDRQQLEHTIAQIYGAATDVKKYLEKYIDFELNLPIGTLNDDAYDYFSYYYNQFKDSTIVKFDYMISEFRDIILEGIDIRRRIAIINKCALLHQILVGKTQKLDSSIMCIELFLTVLNVHNLDVQKAKTTFNIKNLFENTSPCANIPNQILPGLLEIQKKYSEIDATGDPKSENFYIKDTDFEGCAMIMCHDFWGFLLACYRRIIGFSDYVEPIQYKDFLTYAENFWNLLQSIS